MGKPIKKILIANRGEIACRVMKTARKMGIATVAVYSDADRKALHVRMADESVHIGASPAIESYLVIDKIIGAAKETGADAIHPGYGFLSENPDFVRACAKAGIIFIGPSAEAMEAMGLKDAAKALMDKAGVPTTPGYLGEKQDGKTLKSEAGKIGYPVLIKAVAGGGGKGMRKVEAAGDFDAMLASCQREAKSSFGDDRVLIEKYITSPRHIEVQVFGDSHGNVVHMFERDCSLQRRHQKVIEEAPAPGMTDAVRKAMTDAAIKAAKAVDYVGAGTVEFIVDGSGALKTDGFWFMEMNTRLQVEHPVTEMVTGLDLVELQIRIAQGGALPKQDEITLTGHAIEARLYAEDPSNDFLPSVGNLSLFRLSRALKNDYKMLSSGKMETLSRVDTGVEEGVEISPFYDPMIAKIILHDEDRDSAIENLIRELKEVKIWPLKTNASYCASLIDNSAFKAGDVSTHFIEIHKEQLSLWGLSDKKAVAIDAAITYWNLLKKPKGTAFDDVASWRLNTSAQLTLERQCDGQEEVFLASIDEVHGKITVAGETFNVSIDSELKPEFYLSVNGDGYIIPDLTREFGPIICADGMCKIVASPEYSLGGVTSENALIAPMPGKVIAVNVAAGDSVTAGDPLIVMEAMKMEMTLDAPRDGVVASVGGEAGDLVGDGHILLELEDE